MSVPNDNDAGRLYNILEKLVLFQNNSPYNAFYEVFAIDESDKFAVHEHYLNLLQLTINVKNMIKKLATKKDLFFSTIDDVANALCLINFSDYDNGLWGFKDAMNDKVIASLEFTSLFLSDKFGEKKLEQTVLEGLHNDVAGLMAEINESTIDAQLKATLIGNLENINFSISKYHIFGTNGIKDAIEKATGAYVLAISEKSVDLDEDRAFLKKIYYKTCGFSNIVSFPQTVYLFVPPAILGTSEKINNVGKVIKNII